MLLVITYKRCGQCQKSWKTLGEMYRKTWLWKAMALFRPFPQPPKHPEIMSERRLSRPNRTWKKIFILGIFNSWGIISWCCYHLLMLPSLRCEMTYVYHTHTPGDPEPFLFPHGQHRTLYPWFLKSHMGLSPTFNQSVLQWTQRLHSILIRFWHYLERTSNSEFESLVGEATPHFKCRVQTPGCEFNFWPAVTAGVPPPSPSL